MTFLILRSEGNLSKPTASMSLYLLVIMFCILSNPVCSMDLWDWDKITLHVAYLALKQGLWPFKNQLLLSMCNAKRQRSFQARYSLKRAKQKAVKNILWIHKVFSQEFLASFILRSLRNQLPIRDMTELNLLLLKTVCFPFYFNIQAQETKL